MIPQKDKKLEEKLAEIVYKHGPLYFPHSNALQNHHKFKNYQRLTSDLSVAQPASLKKLHPVIAHASQPHSKEWAIALA